eukprot:superscaffoldBa00001814_g12127
MSTLCFEQHLIKASAVFVQTELSFALVNRKPVVPRCILSLLTAKPSSDEEVKPKERKAVLSLSSAEPTDKAPVVLVLSSADPIETQASSVLSDAELLVEDVVGCPVLLFKEAADVETKYLLNGFPYLSNDETRPGHQTLGESVVMKLVEPYVGKGRNVTTDNFFTSLTLAKNLLKKNTSLVGTVNKTRRSFLLQSSSREESCSPPRDWNI